MSTSKAPPGAGSRVACWPIQRIMAAGSVRCLNTSWTGAISSMEVSKALLSVAGSSLIGRVLDGAFELAEVMDPEVGQELLDGAEAAGVDHEQVPGALPALVDQAGVTEHLQVPGDGLRGDVEVAGDVADRTRGAGHQLEDDATVWFGQRLEGRVRVHDLILAYGCLPRKATSRCVTGASSGTGTAGPMRGARVSGVTACSAKPRTCAASRPSRSAGWPVARARSQPWTVMSSVVNPARTGPGMSPSGVTWTPVRASPAPTAASAAAEASA